MRVAILDPSLFTGRYDDGLCAAMGVAGHDVALLGRPLRDTDAIVPRRYRYVPRFFGVSERLRSTTGEGRLFRAAKAAEYAAACLVGPIQDIAAADAVHMQWLPFASADRQLLRRLRRLPPALIHTVHNARPYHGDDRAARMQGGGYRAALDQFDALIAHGAPTVDALTAQGVDAARIHIVPHPTMRLAEADAETMASLADPVLPRILFFGTIRPYKGFDILVQACLALWRAGLRFELAVAGKPFMDVAPLFARIESGGYAGNLVLDLGFLKEERLDAHLRKADILAFPYRHIDASGAFLSALRYGKAVVASDVGMFGDLPSDADGDPPVTLVEAGQAPALAEALLPLIESVAKRREAGERARALGARLGDWEDVAVRTASVYEAAIAARAAR